jgi:2-succinyl-5-enolpyruvyl-6-hydroxy-3-cyclohexene-1-carboxylate synthase
MFKLDEFSELCSMLHDKSGLEHLSQLLSGRGINHLVVSPGSRNAPVVTTLCSSPAMKCYTVVDERSAAFFALGMAQQLQQAVAVCCTSGSAVLNYAPAVAEAYYQRIPLVVLTADRPAAWIDQGDGQTIRQHNVFGHFIKKSVSLPQHLVNKDDIWYYDRLISEALNAAVYPVAGPVHINLPFAEPLYGFGITGTQPEKDIQLTGLQTFLPIKTLGQLADEWNNAPKVMILAGQMPADPSLNELLQSISHFNNTVVLTETTSNLHGEKFIGCIDRTLSAMKKDEVQIHQPNILITFGTAVVSKRIKDFLRKTPALQHWHIDPAELHMDTYQHLCHSIPMPASDFMQQLLPLLKPAAGNYAGMWHDTAAKASSRHHTFLHQADWSDLKVFETILNHLPGTFDLQLGNSTVIRYAQLFGWPAGFRFDSNRGTSGIDGCTSTASGAAVATGKPTLLITGDLAFFYDSNALWNKHLPANLRIIVINNGGGGIFRYLEGPEQTGLLEDFFEASHKLSAVKVAEAYGIRTAVAVSEEQLIAILPAFFSMNANSPMLLEIITPAIISAQTLRNYFKELGN